MNAPSAAVAAKIGPGRLVLVVGPSGAGKDTLIDHVRKACADEARIVFPRRIVTRASSEAEDHETLTPDAFDQARAQGHLALSWEAHGLKYGLPRSINTDIEAGHAVVANVSRTIIPDARVCYRSIAVVLVTAPEEVLTARIAARKRASDGAVHARVQRSASIRVIEPDFTIENVGSVEENAKVLLDVIRRGI